MVKRLNILIIFFLASFYSYGQNFISYVTVNPDNAYIGQSVELKVSVYTTTWFTSGIDVGNIKVDGALTVYFRSLSQTKTFSGKKYAGVDFFYNLFPTKDGEIIIPPLEILVESPKEGDYKGIKHTIKTKAKSLNVKGVPLGYDPGNWLVARNLNVTEKWSASLNNVKVGDVLQRTISRSASGTLSEFIPETKWDSIAGVSLYPKRPISKTNKSKTSVSSQRLETVNYLFEKEGEITIPGIEYVYWNFSNKKFYKKQIDSVTINVSPNADLAMLKSIKNSLQKEKEEAIIEEEKEFLILGMTPKTFLKYLLILILGVYVAIKLLKRAYSSYVNYRKTYLKSEKYAFNKAKKSLHKKDFKSFLSHCNTWLTKLEIKHISWDVFLNKYGTPQLIELAQKMSETIFKNQQEGDSKSYTKFLEELKKSRKDYFKQQKENSSTKLKDTKWLNPTSFD